MQITDFSEGMVLRDGIWFSKDQSSISYPEEGNDLCYQIEDPSYWFNHRNDCISILVERFSKHDTFFDIGGGNGFVSLGLQRAGIDSVLLEPGVSGALHAKERGLKNIICSTLEAADIRPGTVASAGAFDVIEHIEDDVAFLRTIAATMRQGGHLYLTVPAFKFLWSDEDVFAGHYRRYTISSLTQALNEAGFEVVHATYMFSILALPILLFRSLPSLFNLRRGGNKQNFQREHSLGDGLLGRLFKRSFAWEKNRLRNLQTLPLGSSCLAVARKI